MARSALLNVMVQAVLKAGRGLARDFGEVENLQVSVKGPGDFVSAADKRAEKTLVTELQRVRPGYRFLTEETGVIDGTDPNNRWVIDPLDGTTNFLHGIPLFAISVALEREGQLHAGVIYNPILNELYVAERGAGAFLNDRRLRVAGRRKIEDAVITLGIPSIGRPEHDRRIAEQRPLMKAVAGIRRTGSAAMDLAWVASGRFDAYIDHGLSPWDSAAGLLLVREAGGVATDTDGKSDPFVTGDVLAANEQLHSALASVLKSARQSQG